MNKAQVEDTKETGLASISTSLGVNDQTVVHTYGETCPKKTDKRRGCMDDTGVGTHPSFRPLGPNKGPPVN